MESRKRTRAPRPTPAPIGTPEEFGTAIDREREKQRRVYSDVFHHFSRLDKKMRKINEDYEVFCESLTRRTETAKKAADEGTCFNEEAEGDFDNELRLLALKTKLLQGILKEIKTYDILA